MANKLTQGDRIGYAAKFLRNTGQHTGNAPLRRGTYVGQDKYAPNYSRVHWDDENERIALRLGDFAESDYCEDVKNNGSLVHSDNIAKVGSAKFTCNDI